MRETVLPNMVLSLSELESKLADTVPQQILETALTNYERIAISFSGAEDVVLIDMASKLGIDFSVFSIDTGRLHPETYQFLNTVREHYRLDLEIIFPDTSEVQSLVREKGLFSFYKDGHKECCSIRKVSPLRRHLAHLDAWITGQRRDQSPSTRSGIPIVQADGAFSTSEHTLVKFNPLANWTSAQVWKYIAEHDVPYNVLHQRGFISIGCEPCTRPVLPNQHERQGRWWWEDSADKECGFHSTNLTDK